jgi:hypothetical protein
MPPSGPVWLFILHANNQIDHRAGSFDSAAFSKGWGTQSLLMSKVPWARAGHPRRFACLMYPEKWPEASMH